MIANCGHTPLPVALLSRVAPSRSLVTHTHWCVKKQRANQPAAACLPARSHMHTSPLHRVAAPTLCTLTGGRQPGQLGADAELAAAAAPCRPCAAPVFVFLPCPALGSLPIPCFLLASQQDLRQSRLSTDVPIATSQHPNTSLIPHFQHSALFAPSARLCLSSRSHQTMLAAHAAAHAACHATPGCVLLVLARSLAPLLACSLSRSALSAALPSPPPPTTYTFASPVLDPPSVSAPNGGKNEPPFVLVHAVVLFVAVLQFFVPVC